MGSLFGGSLGGSSGPPSNSPAGNPPSLFGNPPASQAPNPNSLFGSQSQQQPAQSSLFGQTGQPAGQPAGQSAAQSTGQDPRPAQTQPAYFNSLLERGKKRPLSAVGQNSFEELPNLQLGLDDIRRKARELGASGGRDSPQHGVNTKAYVLLTFLITHSNTDGQSLLARRLRNRPRPCSTRPQSFGSPRRYHSAERTGYLRS